MGIPEKIMDMQANDPVPDTFRTVTSAQGLFEHNAIFTQMYKEVFDAGSGIFLWEPATDALYFNSSYMQMLGYEENEFPYHISTWENLIHEEDREFTANNQRAIIASTSLGDSFESRYRLRMKNGEYRWVIGKGFIVCRDAQGKATFVVGLHIDLMSVDKNLRQHLVQHDRMLFALEAAKDGLWDWDSQTNLVYYSPRYLEMVGYTPENSPPNLSSWSCRVHPDDLNSTVDMQLSVAASPHFGDTYECIYRFLSADGLYKWILGRGKVIHRNKEGHATRIVGLHTDITEFHNTQEALAKLVNIDPLTSLHSRFYFETELSKLRPSHHPISIIYCDIDCLKLVNDHIGHCAGDTLLSTAGHLIRQSIRSTDIAARLGGDEFVILLTRCPEHAANSVMNNLRQNIREYNKTPGIMPVFMSLGLVSTEKNIPQHKLVAQADKAMMHDKAQHRKEHLEATREWIEAQLNTTIDINDIRTCPLDTEHIYATEDSPKI